MNEKRLDYIDFLKFIGLSLIILAHVNPPFMLKMIRCFDVPLLVIISSILVSNSYEKRKDGVFRYSINRFKRLVFPVWIFLIIFFLILYFAFGFSYNFEYYKYSFLLTRYGVGYVWIMLIYLYCALLIPIFEKTKNIKYNYIFLILVYIIYEVFFYKEIGINNKLFDTTFYYIIPYGCLAYLGFNYRKYSNKTKLIITIVFSIIFSLLAIYYYKTTGVFQSVQIAKYPPRLYFLSYGIFCSFLLLTLCENFKLKIYNNKIIKYISNHSLWIYLWHILIRFIYIKKGFTDVWYVDYIIIYVMSITLSFIITFILNKINEKKSLKLLKYLS